MKIDHCWITCWIWGGLSQTTSSAELPSVCSSASHAANDWYLTGKQGLCVHMCFRNSAFVCVHFFSEKNLQIRVLVWAYREWSTIFRASPAKTSPGYTVCSQYFTFICLDLLILHIEIFTYAQLCVFQTMSSKCVFLHLGVSLFCQC